MAPWPHATSPNLPPTGSDLVGYAVADKRDTHRGFCDPTQPERTSSVSLPDAQPALSRDGYGESDAGRTISSAPSGTATGALPFDVDITREIGQPGLLDGPWVAFELWTQNRIYGLSAHLVCARVRDRHTGSDTPDHPTLGARLAGGQKRNKAGLITEVSHPFPEVGSDAVFVSQMGNRLRVSETSPVTRVLVRHRVVSIGPNGELPSWDDITSPDAW